MIGERMVQRCNLCKSSGVVAVKRVNGKYMALCGECLETVKEVQRKNELARSRQRLIERKRAGYMGAAPNKIGLSIEGVV
jgi:hypothetical protein